MREAAVRLPKPIYELVPFFLIGVGSLFVYLVVTGYEYAPTLFIWFTGLGCIIAGMALIAIRMIYRIRNNASDEQPDYE